MMGITDCLIFSLYISVIICSQFKKGKKNRKFLITKGFPSIIESTRRRRTSGGRSTATTGAERRHSNRSSPAGLEHRKKSHPSDDSFFYLFESTRRRRTSGGRSPTTTGAERRHSNRSSPAGLEHRKKSHPSDVFLCISLRARDGIRTRDPRLGKAILHH